MRIFWFLFFFSACMTAQTSENILMGKSSNPLKILEKQTSIAFKKLQVAALKDSIEIKVISGYRSFNRQRSIWNRKYKKYEAEGLTADSIVNLIVTYSTLPGTSRHHWGTDIDIIDASAVYTGDALLSEKFEPGGPFYRLKKWMDNHAKDYGFELVYTNDPERPGFYYEPWHYTYAPVSRNYYKAYFEIEDLLNKLRSSRIAGMDAISDERLQRYLIEHLQGVNATVKTDLK